MVRRDVRESPRNTSSAKKLTEAEWKKLGMILKRNNKKMSPFVREMKTLYEVISYPCLMH